MLFISGLGLYKVYILKKNILFSCKANYIICRLSPKIKNLFSLKMFRTYNPQLE